MRTIITLDGKKINKNAACEMFGKEDMDKRIKEAKEVFFEDPNEECSWWMGIGMLTHQIPVTPDNEGPIKGPFSRKKKDA